MHTYLISYDLRSPGKDYTRLHQHLKSYNWAKPLESLWLIKSSLEIEALRNTIQYYMDINDKILVVDVTKDAAAWDELPNDVVVWMRNNL